MFNNMLMGAAGESIKATSFSVDNSAVFNDGDSQYLNKTFGTPTSSSQFGYSFWVKLAAGYDDSYIISADGSGNNDNLYFDDGKITIQEGGATRLQTTQVLTDFHGWYNVVVAYDLGNGTNNLKLRLYINGAEVTDFDTDTRSSLSSTSSRLNANGVSHDIAANVNNGVSTHVNPFDGYLAEFVFLDGAVITPSDVGETDSNGVWRPIEHTKAATHSTVNAALGGTYTSSGGTAANAWDENTSTSVGEDQSTNEYVQVYKSSGITATKLRFYCQKPSGLGARIENWILYASNSSSFGGEEVTLASGVAPNATGYHEVTFTNTTSYTYYRLFVTDSYDTSNVAINFFDVRLFESATGLTFGNNGFYLPFTASGALGADYGTTRTAPSVSFIASNSSTANTTSSYTFSGQSLGAAASDRKIFLGASMSAHTVATLAFGTVTIGGVTATQIVAGNADYKDSLHPVAIFVADVPSGTTGDIVLNVGSGSAANCGIAIYRATGVGPIVYSDTTNGGSFPSPNTVSLVAQAPRNSVVLMHGNKNGESVRVTLAGVTEDYDFAVEPDAGGDLAIFGGINTSATSSGAVGLTTSATVDSGSASYFGIATIVIGGVGDTSLKEVNSPTQTTDSPTTNAATFSSLITRHQTSFNGVASDWTFTNGNRTLTHTSGSSGDIMAAASQLLQPGQKYHFEAVTESMHSSAYARFALALVPQSMWETDASPLTGTNDQFTISLIKSGGTGSNSATFDNGSLTAPTNKPTTNSRLTFEVDMSTISSTTVRYYFNGSLDTTYSSLAFADEPYYVVSFTGTETDRNGVFNFNFGSSAFTDTPTSGHTGLTAKDAFAGSAPTIEDGSAHFQTTLYTGDNSSGRAIVQTGNSQFQPDLVWLKARTQARFHHLVDVVRGAGNTLQTNQNNAQGSNAPVTDFNSNGFDVTKNSDWDYNDSGTSELGWQWKAGGSASANNTGNVTVQLSANQTAGFSIGTFNSGVQGSGITLGHGLGAVPKMIWMKTSSAVTPWWVYFEDVGNTKYLQFGASGNSTPATNAKVWRNTTPTSTIFTTSGEEGGSGWLADNQDNVFYAFAEIPGFSKFGAFTSGSSGNPFIECGFTPALIFLKRTSANDDWYVQDTTRDPNNPAYRYLIWNTTATEASNSNVFIDIISNGFVCDLSGIVTSNDDMIFGAWASNPFAGTTPATAR